MLGPVRPSSSSQHAVVHPSPSVLSAMPLMLYASSTGSTPAQYCAVPTEHRLSTTQSAVAMRCHLLRATLGCHEFRHARLEAFACLGGASLRHRARVMR
eukprot:scaffold24530_cov149-Isochrysis_galbana.AAC.2